jgi:L-Ala-D/L-Glu epimerase
MPEIVAVTAYPVDMPLRDAFETSKGRKTTSPAVAVEVGLANGMTGFGAATPVLYVTGEDIDDVLASVERCRPSILGKDITGYRPLFNAIYEALPDKCSARAALEMAVIDGFCKQYGLPMYRFFGGTLGEVETDVTIPICEPDKARELSREAAANGFHHLKVKVGGKDQEEDFARVIAMHEGAPNCTIRLDANQGFTPSFAVEYTKRLLDAGVIVDMLEQPVDRDDLEGLAYVTANTPVSVFADEACRNPADAIKLVQTNAVDGINIKLMKAGISGALDIIAVCRAAGKELMLGCMLETGIGMATSVHFAAGTGVFSRLDLDGHLLAADMPFPGGFTHEGPYLRPNASSPGHGATGVG